MYFLILTIPFLPLNITEKDVSKKIQIEVNRQIDIHLPCVPGCGMFWILDKNPNIKEVLKESIENDPKYPTGLGRPEIQVFHLALTKVGKQTISFKYFGPHRGESHIKQIKFTIIVRYGE